MSDKFPITLEYSFYLLTLNQKIYIYNLFFFQVYDMVVIDIHSTYAFNMSEAIFDLA